MDFPEWVSLNEAADTWFEFGAFGDFWNEPGHRNMTFTPRTASEFDSDFSNALSIPEFEAKGVKRVDNKRPQNGPLETIPAIYFRQQRTFRPHLNRIEAHHEKLDQMEFEPTREGGERHPDWLDVSFSRDGFLNWLHARQEGITVDDVSEFRKKRRWSLVTTLVWIASRDFKEACRAERSNLSYSRASLRFMGSYKELTLGANERISIQVAWSDCLASAMADGQI